MVIHAVCVLTLCAQVGGFNLGGWQGDFLLICGYGDNEWLKSETWVELGATSLAGDSELWAGDWTLTVGCFTDAHSSCNYEGHRRRRTKTTSSWSIYCYSEKKHHWKYNLIRSKQTLWLLQYEYFKTIYIHSIASLLRWTMKMNYLSITLEQLFGDLFRLQGCRHNCYFLTFR